MTVRKMLLSATAAVVALVLSAPGAASAAEYWWYDHEIFKAYPTFENPKEVLPVGELSITREIEGKVQQFGPCEYVFGGTIWNEEKGMGEGELESSSEGEECPTSIGGTCKVVKSTPLELPWKLTLTSAKEVEVLGVKIETHLSAGCGLPQTSTATGKVSGSFVDAVNHGTQWTQGTIEFNKAGGLFIGGIIPVKLDGLVRFGTWVTAVAQ